MKKSAVIDRFEGEYAILTLDGDQRQLKCVRSLLPNGVLEGTWLQIEIEGDHVVNATIDQEKTDNTLKRIKEKLEGLQRGEK